MRGVTFEPPPPASRSPLVRRRYLLHASTALVATALLPAGAWAGSQGEVTDLRIERTPRGVLLSAAWRMDLPLLVENALYQGIAMHFIAEVQVVRPRWYWRDKTVAHAVRYLRLSYQPLTRRWRLVQSSTDRSETEGAAASLGQSFDELEDALAALQRVAGWKIADAAALDEGSRYVLDFQFRLDTAQLPRLLQFGAVGRSSWEVAIRRRMEFTAAEATP